MSESLGVPSQKDLQEPPGRDNYQYWLNNKKIILSDKDEKAPCLEDIDEKDLN